MCSICLELLKGIEREVLAEGAKGVTLIGLEPTRNYSNLFLFGRLNHSATVSIVL